MQDITLDHYKILHLPAVNNLHPFSDFDTSGLYTIELRRNSYSSSSLPLPNSSRILNMSTSSSTSPTASKITMENPGLGTLVKLPREVRDEIYRYLVKGAYHLLHPVPFFVPPSQRRKRSKFDHTTLQLSKTINHEAAEVYFSESSFAINLFYIEGMTKVPQESFDRMMSVGFLVRCDERDINNDNRGIWEATIQQFNGAKPIRGDIHVVFDIHSSLKFPSVPNSIFYSSGSLTRYRVVLLEAFIAFDQVNRDTRGSSAAEEAIKNCNEKGGLLIAAVMEDLEPALGPAILHRPTSPIPTARHRYRFSFLLEFHPHEYMEKIKQAARW